MPKSPFIPYHACFSPCGRYNRLATTINCAISKPRKPRTMPQDPIRVGIAGLGRSGWAIHAHLLAPLTDKFQIVAVTDEDSTRCSEAIERFHCQAYPTYDELIADPAVELVVVALPSFLHASASIAALESKRHVVCEKPMAVTMEEADRMVAAAAASDRVFTVFQVRRYNPDFLKVREIIDSGILGRI